jgi:hypothetical protein
MEHPTGASSAIANNLMTPAPHASLPNTLYDDLALCLLAALPEPMLPDLDAALASPEDAALLAFLEAAIPDINNVFDRSLEDIRRIA